MSQINQRGNLVCLGNVQEVLQLLSCSQTQKNTAMQGSQGGRDGQMLSLVKCDTTFGFIAMDNLLVVLQWLIKVHHRWWLSVLCRSLTILLSILISQAFLCVPDLKKCFAGCYPFLKEPSHQVLTLILVSDSCFVLELQDTLLLWPLVKHFVKLLTKCPNTIKILHFSSCCADSWFRDAN